MDASEHTDGESPYKPLVRCPECGSGLIQLMADRGWDPASGVASRWCPECDHRDLVAATSRALRLWAAREDRVRENLAELADTLARVNVRLYV